MVLGCIYRHFQIAKKKKALAYSTLARDHLEYRVRLMGTVGGSGSEKEAGQGHSSAFRREDGKEGRFQPNLGRTS